MSTTGNFGSPKFGIPGAVRLYVTTGMWLPVLRGRCLCLWPPPHHQPLLAALLRDHDAGELPPCTSPHSALGVRPGQAVFVVTAAAAAAVGGGGERDGEPTAPLVSVRSRR
eukprot:COSAG01_NODE_15922_length_1285_cov_18.428331_1_plen_110_part_10